MNDGQELKLAGELAEIKNELKNVVSSFNDFKHGIGKTVQDHDQAITSMQGKVDLMLWLAAKVATPILSAIGASVVVITGWVIFKK